MLQVWGNGVRVGALSLTAKDLYWFIVENRKEVNCSALTAAAAPAVAFAELLVSSMKGEGKCA